MQDIDTHIKQLVTSQQAWYYSIVPKDLVSDCLHLYVSEDNYPAGLEEELQLLLDKTIQLFPISEKQINEWLARNYRKFNNTIASTYEASSTNHDFLNLIIQEACELKSSDIHIEVYEEKARVRLRIDGKLLEKYIIKKSDYPTLVNKIKIKANLDISEKRLPQDGRILFDQGEKFDIRVSVLPSMYGEKIVLRLLKRDATDLNLQKLGLSQKQLKDYLIGIKKTHGIVLISGPTGSGKTTTLYSTLKELNNNSNNILTIEDPIEYTLEGINQVQLKEDIGLTFAKALRTFLRQDPDIIMLGEIRDKETAQMAIRASLTGHLVLSTIHTNSAWEIVSRLLDMGIPSYLLASTLNLAVAQRLIRLLCPSCKKKVPLDKDNISYSIINSFALEDTYVPVGCDKCHYTGYKGRKAIYEVILVDHEMENIIRKESDDIETYLEKMNCKRLKNVAGEILVNGESSIDEVLPIIIS